MTPDQKLTNEQIIDDFRSLIGEEQVLGKLIERTIHAGDASIYRLVPRVVVQPRHAEDVRQIFNYCRNNDLYLTFRAAGTSLSGQAVTDGVLVDVSKHWKRLRIEEEGRRVAVEPGIIGSHVNAMLAMYKAKIGPDPASINACMMGGIAANNASGMCCGVQFNSYHTMASMKLILADGLALDTADSDADDVFQSERPKIYDGVLRIRNRIRRDADLAARICRKYSVKNTCGYSMNAFIDFDRPIDILAHLLIGSEGTLGFISEITLNTLPDKPVKATALVYFRELADAGAAIFPLADDGAAVLEIMDRASMLSVAEEMKYGFDVAGNCAALLVEFQEEDEAALDVRLKKADAILQKWPLMASPEFTRDPETQAAYWHMRKGLFPSVGAMREMGTAVIIEDVCVSPARLADCIIDLQALFQKHDFPDAIIFGHARDGNLHFVICNDFSEPQQVARYAALMDDLTRLIVDKYDGSLKAEHGTGRNIAPFVELEWGSDLYGLMWEVKELLDRDGVLNPGVILNRDPQVHLKDLKVMPVVSPHVDKCIECGFCEPRCPSRDLTTTPRQRIAVAREMERLRAAGDATSLALLHEIEHDYRYYGIDTCAGDGMCATSCPVKIDTGAMIKDFRFEAHSSRAQRRAVLVARHFGVIAKGARLGLLALHAGGNFSRAAARVTAEILHRVSRGVVPRLPREIPVPFAAPRLPRTSRNGSSSGRSDSQKIIYFPACLTRSLGKLPEEKSNVGLAEATVRVLEKCGFEVLIPQGIGNHCCGQAFFSKGFYPAATEAARRTVDVLWQASNEGEIPILCDTSPCTGQLLAAEKMLTGEDLKRWRDLNIQDFPAFMARTVLPERDDWPTLERDVILHPTCTLIKMGGLNDLKKVANTFASRVTVPVLAECCGFAGDKGFNVPELTLSATRPEAEEVLQTRHLHAEPGEQSHYYSTCRTCEIGMTAATSQVYQSIIYLCYDALISNGRAESTREREPASVEA